MKRRVLGTLAAGVVLSALEAPAAMKTTVETAGYEGQSTGSWTCGPRAPVNYGGLATRVRLDQREADRERDSGATVALGGALEVARFTLHEESLDEPEQSEDISLEGANGGDRTPQHDTRLFPAGEARIGYHGKYVGIEGGGLVVSSWTSPTSSGVGFIPELELRLGRRDTFCVFGGVGTPNAAWMTHPGLGYVGVGLVLPRAIEVQAFGGLFRGGPELTTISDFAGNVSWYVPMNDELAFKGGLGLGTSEGEPLRQTTLGLRWRL